MYGSRSICVCVLTLFALSACQDASNPAAPDTNADVALSAHAAAPATVVDLLSLEAGPVAIAHRGMGANRGEDPTRPIENTVEAVRQGYETGARVVEVDLAVTADGEIVASHEDFLQDGTCINTLTREELQAKAPHIGSFQAIIQTAKRYNRGGAGRLAGLLTVDVKPASPLCDPEDTTEAAFVRAVVRTVRQMGATDLIYFNSMSPVLLGIAAQEAPDIPRQLTTIVLQFLTPAQVEAAVGLPVTLIDKDPDYGLRWAEIGPVHRLPGYTSPQQAIQAAAATGSRIISYDLRLLGQLEQMAPGTAAQLVQGTKALGFSVFGGDVSAPEHWFFGAALGLDALYADDVPLAVSLQPPLG